MKSAKEFWKEKFEEYPQTDADKLAVVMMSEYLNYFKEYSENNKRLSVLKNIDSEQEA